MRGSGCNPHPQKVGVSAECPGAIEFEDEMHDVSDGDLFVVGRVGNRALFHPLYVVCSIKHVHVRVSCERVARVSQADQLF